MIIPEKIREQVVEIVEKFEEEKKRPMLTSDFGVQIKDVNYLHEYFPKGEIVKILSAHFPELRIVHGRGPQRFIFIRNKVEGKSDDDIVKAKNLTNQMQPYYPLIYFAFSSPIVNSKVRYVIIRGGRFSVKMNEDPGAMPHGAHEIRFDDLHIVDQPFDRWPPADREQVETTIKEWCTANAVNPSIFVQTRPGRTTERRLQNRIGREESSLGAAFDQLTDSDLSRILVPADIVRRLLKG